MPEYLAPGVYVEETSFRGKSIEGVSTSTTGFVGPTRKGPVGETPELITSFGDFERIYGALEDLGFATANQTNYLAHAVLHYFNEGGSRLYVSRAFLAASTTDLGVAKSARLVDGGSEGKRAWFVARFPGQAGNGTIAIGEVATPATKNSMAGAPEGTLLRAGIPRGKTPAGPARLASGLVPPFRVAENGVLELLVDGTSGSITFAKDKVSDLTTVTADDINALLVGAATPINVRAALSPSSGALLLASLDVGKRASLAVQTVPNSVHAALGLSPAAAVGGAGPGLPARIVGGAPPFTVADGAVLDLAVGGAAAQPFTFTAANPGNLNNVTADVIDSLLKQNNIAVHATLENGHLVLSTIATGASASLAVQAAAASSAHTALGLTVGATNGSDAPARLVGRAEPFTVSAGGVLALTVNGTPGQITFATGSVPNLSSITAADINGLLASAGIAATASLDPNGRLVIATKSTGSGASIGVLNVPNSVNSALGLAVPASGSDGVAPTYYVKRSGNWQDQNSQPLDLSSLAAGDAPGGGAEFVTLTVVAADADGHVIAYDNLGFDPEHPRFVGHVLAQAPARRADALQNPFALKIGADVSGFDLHGALFSTGEGRIITLSGGDDGVEPTEKAYEDALAQLAGVEDISIVAAPGSSAYQDFAAIQGALITHVERPRAYRIAVLDTQPGLVVSEARDERSRMDSTRAALYYPWVVVSNPLFRPGQDSIPREIPLPPSGFISGIYARSDDERGVIKAPANEVVLGALRFESDVNFAQQEVLNPLGVNCLRYFPGRGYRVWGARTASSDPEWKYVNIRRYFIYLEASIDRGTQWAVFEPNGERLWANVRSTISDFLYNEWVSGALLGSRPEDAFFVRCDRSTMTQNDLDNGRLICLVGVAALKPAEFVIFRIGQKTVEAR